MMHKADIIALEDRAHIARLTLPEICREARVFRQSFYRARKNGRMDYGLYTKLEQALERLEREKANA